MALENPKKEFKFLNPITGKGALSGAVHNFPFGVGQLDFTNLKKNIPNFEELAESFGKGQIKKLILKNTLDLVTTGGGQLTGPSGPFLYNTQPRFDPGKTGDDSPLQPVGKSVFGMPVYSNLSIRAGSYNDNHGEPIAQYDDIRVDSAIFEISRDNNLVVTDIQGRDNSIIEYISGKSYNINCKGRILSLTPNGYPTLDTVQLITALNSNKSLRVDSWFLNMFGIYNIVIKRKSFPQEEGGMEYQKFEFDAIADYAVVFRRPK
jgi:hypothetical protein